MISKSNPHSEALAVKCEEIKVEGEQPKRPKLSEIVAQIYNDSIYIYCGGVMRKRSLWLSIGVDFGSLDGDLLAFDLSNRISFIPLFIFLK